MECNDQLVSLTFCSRTSSLKLLHFVLCDAADMVGLDEQATDAVVLAVNEACTNIIQHAYKMETNGRIDVTLIHEQGALVIQLRDYAHKVDVEMVCSRDLDDVRPGGLGVHLIDSLMDECGFIDPPEGVGNLFQMKKYTGT